MNRFARTSIVPQTALELNGYSWWPRRILTEFIRDDLAFWDRGLSDAEIAELYTSGRDLNFFVNPPLPAPEPSSLLLFALGGLGLVRYTRRQNQRA